MSHPTIDDSGPCGTAELWLADHREDLSSGLAALQDEADRIERWANHLASVLTSGGRLLAAGNGGSAAEAQHLTAELVGRFDGPRAALSAISLHAETSSLTAIVNDYGVDEMFARQVAAHGRPGDVLILLSTSGESANVVSAARRGRDLGLIVWALTGPTASTLAEACDDVLRVSATTTAGVQELHLVAVHALCAALEVHVRSGPTSVHDVGTTLPGSPSPDVQAPAMAPRTDEPLITVVGDVVLDRDVDGQVTRLCPDTPVPVVDTLEVRQSPGGAGLTAILCAQSTRVRLVAPIAVDGPAVDLTRLLKEHVDLVRLPQEGTTRRKTRVRSAGQTVVRVDDGGPARPGVVREELVTAAVENARVLLVSDYGAGITYDGPVRDVVARTARTIPVVWDPHPRGGPPVAGAAIVTPNLAEALDAATALGLTIDPEDVGGLAQVLCRSWDVGAVAVTVGHRGAFVATPDGYPVYVPARSVDGDPCGAGDRFAATVAVALAHGTAVLDAVVQAVAAATAWVEAGGADGFRRRSRRSTHPGPQQPPVPERTADAARNDPLEVERIAARLRQSGSLVATGGCFDILHAGHVATLEAAARLGDRLVVLLNSDESVRRLKGPRRPVTPEADRARLLLALDCVAEVLIFDDDDPTAMLERLRPDVWAKGGDYVAQDLPESSVVRRHGGRVVVLPYIEGRSTTAILDRSSTVATTSTKENTP